MGELVHVIWIPGDGSALRLEALPWLSVSDLDYWPEESAELEHYLGHIPDLIGRCELPAYEHWPGFKAWRDYAWQHRSLVDLGYMDPDKQPGELSEYPGPYFMYKCSKESEVLACNKHFEGVPGAAGVYGDAFIFKVKEPAFIDWLMVRYDELDEDFIRNAFKGKGIASEDCLKWLSEQCCSADDVANGDEMLDGQGSSCEEGNEIQN